MSIPKNMKLWERWFDKDGKVTHIVASNETKTKWYLYTADGEKVKVGKTPLELR